MRRIYFLMGGALVLIAFLAFVIVPDWHFPVAARQLGWRASSMVQFAPTGFRASLAAPALAAAAVPPDHRPSTTAYRNIQVLKDADAGEVMKVMGAMTAWVAPKQGCGFCHAGGDYASEANPRKNVARLMLAMTRHINTSWRTHVGSGGVTCGTCHQGQPVPDEMWFASRPQPVHPMIDKQEDWHEDAKTVRKFFPYEGYEEYLLEDTPGVAQSYTALPTGNVQSQVVVKRLYEMMMQMSDGIGVNCGFCHNSRAFFDWRQSTPERWTGYSGIQMTRDLNRTFLLKVGALMPQTRFALDKADERNLPAHEEGALAGNGLADCATCHHGLPKPATGVNLASAYPELQTASPAPPPPSNPPKGGR